VTSKDTVNSIVDKTGPMAFLNMGESALTLQKEILDAYAQLNRAWFARMESEVALWSDLAAKLSATGSFPEALEAYRRCVSRQMEMTAEDGQRLFNDYQQMTQKVTKSLTTPIAIRNQTKSSSARPIPH
jgi:hypothetical protein